MRPVSNLVQSVAKETEVICKENINPKQSITKMEKSQPEIAVWVGLSTRPNNFHSCSCLSLCLIEKQNARNHIFPAIFFSQPI